jgi:cellulose synthase/poly-beta-1,6-N-acetylglucosamine synthase-like glycosyltransferase
VQHELPHVTIIVPTKPGQAEIMSVEAARELNYPREKLELIVARGKQPAIQRNHALREASGEIIYFLDDDSQPESDALRRAVEHFEDPKVQMVGGPNLCPPDAPFLEQIFAVALSSWIAFGPSRARYDRVGKARATSEKELILCNLLARRSALLELGGFDEALYPNEENALMDELQKRGGKLIYDPDAFVFRRPRRSVSAFCKMLMTYGRGRAEQFRLHPTFGSAMNFVPPLFVLFLLLAPLWAWLGWFSIACNKSVVTMPQVTVTATDCHFGIAWYPLGAYVLALVFQTIANCGKGIVPGCAALPLLFATHVFYGLGFWSGLFSRVEKTKPATTEVTLERIAL